jgi:hypothetical protein
MDAPATATVTFASIVQRKPWFPMVITAWLCLVHALDNTDVSSVIVARIVAAHFADDARAHKMSLRDIDVMPNSVALHFVTREAGAEYFLLKYCHRYYTHIPSNVHLAPLVRETLARFPRLSRYQPAFLCWILAKCFEGHRDAALSVVRGNGAFLKYLAHEMQDDETLVTAAVEDCSYALEFATERLRRDPEFALTLLRTVKCSVFPDMDSELRSDPRVVTAAAFDGDALLFASICVRDNKDVAMQILHESAHKEIKKYYLPLLYLSPRLQSDIEIVSAAVSAHWKSLMYADVNLRDDKNSALKLVCINGRVLKYISSRLRSDIEIVSAAVSAHWKSLKYASHELRCNKEFASTLIRIDTRVVRYLSPELQNDPDVLAEQRNARGESEPKRRRL